MERDNVIGLSDKEIEEELLNNDLKALGIKEDELSNMETQEKKQLLNALNQSTSGTQQFDSLKPEKQNFSKKNNSPASGTSSNNNNNNNNRVQRNPFLNSKPKREIDLTQSDDNSSDGFPCLPTPSSTISSSTCNINVNDQTRKINQNTRPNNNNNNNQGLKRPLQQSLETVNLVTDYQQNNQDSEDESGEDNSEEEEDDEEESFRIPDFVDDCGIQLKDDARKKIMFRSARYYLLPDQSHKDAIRFMVRHYNHWFKDWCLIEKDNSSVLVKCMSVSSLSDRHKNLMNETINNNNNKIRDQSPETSYSMKLISTSAVSTNNKSNCKGNESSSSGQAKFQQYNKRTSTSPDVEEIEVSVVKTPEKNTVNPQKGGTLLREARIHNLPSTPSGSGNSSSDTTMNLDEKWDPQTCTWTTPRRPRSNKRFSRLSTKIMEKEQNKQEPKVQCPICQLDFFQSKVESHAALCEGFPTQTRSATPTKLGDSNSKDDFTNNSVIEKFNTSECKAEPNSSKSKKRDAELEEHSTPKRIRVDKGIEPKRNQINYG